MIAELPWTAHEIADAYAESLDDLGSLLPGEAQDEAESTLDSIVGDEP